MNGLKGLKKCKSLKDVYQIIPEDFYEKSSLAMMILMLFMIVFETFVRCYTVVQSDVGYMIQYFNGAGYVAICYVILIMVIRAAGVGTAGIKAYFKANKQDILFIIMLLYAFAATLMSHDRSMAFFGKGVFYAQTGFRSYLIYAALYICGKNIRYRRSGQGNNSKRYVYLSFMLACTFQSTLVITAWLGYQGSMAGVFYNTNHMGYFMAIVIFAIIGYLSLENRKKLKAVGFVLYVINIVCLILNDTFGGYIAVLVGLFFMTVIYFIKYKRLGLNIILSIALFAATSVIMDLHTHIVSTNFGVLSGDVKDISSSSEMAGMAGSGRWELWSDAVEYIKANPVIGCGPDCMSALAVDKEWHAIDTKNEQKQIEHCLTEPHNEYLQYAGEVGLPALIIYIAGLIIICVKRIKNIKDDDESLVYDAAAVISYCVSAFFGVNMFYTEVFYFAFLGMVSSDSAYGENI